MRDAEGLKEYYPNGQLEWSIPMAVPDGGAKPKRHGTAKSYWPDGTLKIEREYVWGVISGVETIYYHTANKWQQFTYVDGKKNGLFKFWYPDGTLESSGTYRNDQLVGEYQRFNKDGSVAFSKNYGD